LPFRFHNLATHGISPIRLQARGPGSDIAADLYRRFPLPPGGLAARNLRMANSCFSFAGALGMLAGEGTGFGLVSASQ
jgi:hypothetical protein